MGVYSGGGGRGIFVGDEVWWYGSNREMGSETKIEIYAEWHG